jgi:hypothetical protein
MAANCVIGALYVTFLHFYLKRAAVPASSPLYYVPACFASTFWAYKNGIDYPILAFCSMLFLVLALQARSKPRFLLCLFAALYPALIRLAIETVWSANLYRSVDGLLLLLLGVLLCGLWVKRPLEDSLTTDFPNYGRRSARRRNPPNVR